MKERRPSILRAVAIAGVVLAGFLALIYVLYAAAVVVIMSDFGT